MAGMSEAALGNNPRTAAEVEAARANVAAVSPENVAPEGSTLTAEQQAAASDFAYKFTDALGIEDWTIFGNDLTKKQLKNMSPEEQNGAIREYIGENVEPNDLLDALAETDPKAQGLVDIIKADPELATAFHSAVVKDPTVLAGLRQLSIAEGPEALNLADLEKTLGAEGLVGTVARNQFKNALNQVADTDLEFAHLMELGNGVKADFSGFITEFMQNPESAINKLFDTLEAGGQLAGMDPAMQDMLRGFMLEIAPFMQFMFEPYHELAVKYDLGAETPGRIMDHYKHEGLRRGMDQETFEKTVDGKVDTNISRDQFIDKFKAAMDGKELTEENVLEAARSVDASFKDETILITTNADLSSAFRSAVNLSNLDAAAQDLATVRDNIADNTDPAISGADQVRQSMGMALT